VLETEKVVNGCFKPFEARAPRVSLVAREQRARAPLRRAHGACAAVCEQIDCHILGAQMEKVQIGA
jgi:hypothetical protein